MKSKRIVAVLTVCIITILVVSQTPVSAIESIPSDLNIGPYVDKIVYNVIANQDQRILALQAGEIEMDTSIFDPVYLPQLDADPDIDIFSPLRNGYVYITINCDKYPLSISAFRRAFAFAFNKTAVTADVLDGFSQEHDSLVPYANSWCIEDEFSYHYYTDQTAIGAQILADANFTIDGGTGYLLAPNGEPFSVTIEYPSSSPGIAGGTAQIGVDALRRLGVSAQRSPKYMGDFIARLDTHGEYDMVLNSVNFYSNDVDWLSYQFGSELADVRFQNPTNFVNETFDYWRGQLLYNTTYEGVYRAASEMQKILHYNVPRLVVYQNTYLQAYRNNQFTGHVEDFGKYISGPWTMRKIQKLDGSFGGTVPIAIDDVPDVFNIFRTRSAQSALILENLYASLYKRGPDLSPWPDLATNMITETHADNAEVPDGHTRFTMDIVQNATWSDGTPLTADDVVFTQVYAFMSSVYDNPAGQGIGDLNAVYAPTPYRAVIEFNTESLWHFSNFAYDYIIPIHIFNDTSGIGYENWEFWNPVLDPEEPHVTCGPYLLTDFEEGESYELTRNPRYHYLDSATPLGPGENPCPVLHSVSNVSYYVGTTGNEIIWEITDDNPLNYLITQDFTVLYSSPWDGSTIKYNVDGLEVGTHEFRLNLFDESGNFVGSTVFVNVLSNLTATPTDIPVIYTIALGGLSSASLIVILYVVVDKIRKRRILGR